LIHNTQDTAIPTFQCQYQPGWVNKNSDTVSRQPRKLIVRLVVAIELVKRNGNVRGSSTQTYSSKANQDNTSTQEDVNGPHWYIAQEQAGSCLHIGDARLLQQAKANSGGCNCQASASLSHFGVRTSSRTPQRSGRTKF